MKIGEWDYDVPKEMKVQVSSNLVVDFLPIAHSHPLPTRKGSFLGSSAVKVDFESIPANFDEFFELIPLELGSSYAHWGRIDGDSLKRYKNAKGFKECFNLEARKISKIEISSRTKGLYIP